MDFEIKELNADGSGYMVVTRDGGPTFGQMFRNLPMDSDAAAKDYLSTLAEQTVQAQPVPVKPVDAMVLQMQYQTILIDPNRKGAISG